MSGGGAETCLAPVYFCPRAKRRQTARSSRDSGAARQCGASRRWVRRERPLRSTAPDTCFYVRLDIVRDGVALAVRDDIDSLCRVEKEYSHGEERVLRFVFAEHALRIRPGDRLRLDVSSSCAPYFQVHTNRKGLQALQTGADVCRNTIVMGASKVRLFTK